MLTDADARVRATAAGAIQTMCVNQTAKPVFLGVRDGVKVRDYTSRQSSFRCRAAWSECAVAYPFVRRLFVCMLCVCAGHGRAAA